MPRARQARKTALLTAPSSTAANTNRLPSRKPLRFRTPSFLLPMKPAFFCKLPDFHGRLRRNDGNLSFKGKQRLNPPLRNTACAHHNDFFLFQIHKQWKISTHTLSSRCSVSIITYPGFFVNRHLQDLPPAAPYGYFVTKSTALIFTKAVLFLHILPLSTPSAATAGTVFSTVSDSTGTADRYNFFRPRSYCRR